MPLKILPFEKEGDLSKIPPLPIESKQFQIYKLLMASPIKFDF